MALARLSSFLVCIVVSLRSAKRSSWILMKLGELAVVITH